MMPGEWLSHHGRTDARPMLRCFSIALLAFSIAICPLPLRAQEGTPSQREIIEFNKNFLDAMNQFLNDKEVSDFLGVYNVISLAIYNCTLIEKGIVKPGSIDELLSQYYLEVYDAPERDMAINMQSLALSDYIAFPENVVKLCDPKRILPRFQGLPISPPN